MYELELRNYVKAAIGTSAVHWQIAPDHADYPMVMLHPVSATIGYSQDGADEDNSAIVQVDIWAAKSDAAILWKNSLVNALGEFEPTETIGGIFITNIRAGIDTSTEAKLFRQSIDLRLIGRLT